MGSDRNCPLLGEPNNWGRFCQRGCSELLGRTSRGLKQSGDREETGVGGNHLSCPHIHLKGGMSKKNEYLENGRLFYYEVFQMVYWGGRRKMWYTQGGMSTPVFRARRVDLASHLDSFSILGTTPFNSIPHKYNRADYFGNTLKRGGNIENLELPSVPTRCSVQKIVWKIEETRGTQLLSKPSALFNPYTAESTSGIKHGIKAEGINPTPQKNQPTILSLNFFSWVVDSGPGPDPRSTQLINSTKVSRPPKSALLQQWEKWKIALYAINGEFAQIHFIVEKKLFNNDLVHEGRSSGKKVK